MYCDKENINILTALLVKHGVRHVVVCPGSRNAPLAHNFNECPELTCHSMTDERSAAFFALGIRQQTLTPVAICVTSGSALLNTLPGVAEATYQQQGIIVISADRPAAWIGQNDGQTLPQQGALGCFVAKSVTLPEPRNDEERWMCNRLINEAMIAHKGMAHPSVHINIPISEPLFTFSTPQLPEERMVRTADWHCTSERNDVTKMFWQSERRMIIAGQMPKNNSIDSILTDLSEYAVVLGEPISCSCEHPMLTDQMLHAIGNNNEAYHPECVIYIGGNTISKRLRHFMRSMKKDTVFINICTDGELHDISQNTSILIDAHPETVLSDLMCSAPHAVKQKAFCTIWNRLRESLQTKLNNYVMRFSQTMAVKEFEQRIGSNASIVYYANSMAIRLSALYSGAYRYCNRGLNGIEGSLSVAAGAAAAVAATGSKENIYCIIGDLSFFYDENALWQRSLSPNLRIMLLNNGRGGIFGMLNGLSDSPAHNGLVDGQHYATAEGACMQHNLLYLRADDASTLQDGLERLQNDSNGKAVLLEVFTDPETDMELYAELYNYIKQE